MSNKRMRVKVKRRTWAMITFARLDASIDNYIKERTVRREP